MMGKENRRWGLSECFIIFVNDEIMCLQKCNYHQLSAFYYYYRTKIIIK